MPKSRSIAAAALVGATDQVSVDPRAEALLERIHELERVLAMTRNSVSSKGALKAAHGLSHQVYVVAEREGYREVANAVWHVEDALLAINSGELEANALAWRQIEAACRAAQAACHEAPVAPDGEGNIASAHLLIIADDTALLESIRRTAEKKRISVSSAQDKAEVLSLAVDGTFDGVVVAWSSSTEGCEALMALKNYAGSRLPAIVLTKDDFESRLAAARAGATLLLPHGVDPEGIVTAFSGLPRQVDEERVVILTDESQLGRERALLDAEGIGVTHVRDPRNVVAAIERTRPQALLLARLVDGVAASEICALIRAIPEWHNLPVFVLGAESGEVALGAYRAGADDVFGLSTSEGELLARMRVRFDRSLSYQEQSNRDVLTGILTRRAFIEAMAARLAEARRAKQHLSLCLCDLDKFKQINDTHGHSVGDEVLATFGLVLNTSFRIEDLRARWGGEEFITAFSGEWADSAREILSRATSRFAKVNFEGAGGQPFNVTVSAGIATYPIDGTSLDELVLVADQRLYAAKLAGRNRIRT